MKHSVGDTNRAGAICKERKGRVEHWVSARGKYSVYLRVTEKDFLYRRREYSDDAAKLFQAVCHTIKRRYLKDAE